MISNQDAHAQLICDAGYGGSFAVGRVTRDATQRYDKQSLVFELPLISGLVTTPVRMYWMIYDRNGRRLGVTPEFEMLVR